MTLFVRTLVAGCQATLMQNTKIHIIVNLHARIQRVDVKLVPTNMNTHSNVLETEA